MFKKFYKNIYSMPALVLHELSHILVSIILGGKLKGVEIKSSCSVELKISNLKNLTQVRLVAMSPLLVPIAFIALSFVDANFIAGVVYSATAFKATLPSSTDFKTSNITCPKFLGKKIKNFDKN
jgi:hypothetical protein